MVKVRLASPGECKGAIAISEKLELTTDMARWQVVSDLSLFREALAGNDWLLALERYYGDFLHGFTATLALFGAE